MSKKRKKTKGYNKTTGVLHRGTHKARTFLRDDLLPSPTGSLPVQKRFPKNMYEVEDHRQRIRLIPRTVAGSKAIIKPNNRFRSPSPYKFSDPRKTVECVRRKLRRRVIFSIPGLRRKGSGSGKRRPPRYRGIRC